jgi:hypothetical protein
VLAEVDPGRWDALLAALGVTDVYATRGYIEASAPLAAAVPAYLHLEGAGGSVLFPALVRDSPADVVGPYGYGGAFGVGQDPPLRDFGAAYGEWCRARGALTSFVIYHPLRANHLAADATGFHAEPLAGTIAWRLEGDLLAGMHRHHRRLARRAEAAGLSVSVVERPDDLAEFVAVYEATMRRAGAGDFYLFGEDHWRALIAGVPLVLVEVRRDGELVAAVLGMGAPPWLHYHLGGSTEDGRGLGASHLALLALARWGAANGYDILHLGGGVGGGEDSLLTFKRRFAPSGLVPAAIGKAVHDPEAYERLTGRARGDVAGFFPAYRSSR